MVIANDNRWRRNLLHGLLGDLTLWSLEFVAVSATTAAANLRLRRLHGGNFRWCDYFNYLPLGRLDHRLPKVVAECENPRQPNYMGEH